MPRTESEHEVSEESQSVGAEKVVSLEYVLTDDAGKTLDKSEEGKPLVYLHGARNIVPGLERALTGKHVGDTAKVTVEPEQAYGKRVPGRTWQISRSSLPKEVTIERGMQLTANGPENRKIPVWVTKVQGPTVTVDPNHPLAGMRLHFDVKVLEIRDATAEEKAHGHAHGPGGHHH